MVPRFRFARSIVAPRFDIHRSGNQLKHRGQTAWGSGPLAPPFSARVGNNRCPVTFLTFVNRFRNIPSGPELGTIGHSTGGSSMHAPDLFLTRATECETMAKIAREADSRAVWTRMAERWHRCAATEMASLAAARQDSDRHQRSSAGRNRH